ncbi:MAG: MarR family winged helix-turn-helix transcriptional regulator [Pseudomonadota bacterium]
MVDQKSQLLMRFARIIAADGYDRDLQPVQWQALSFLRSANRFSRTPKALTAWLGQTKGSVSQTVIALEKKGLVAKRADPGDLRLVRLELTQAGVNLLGNPPAGLAEQMLAHLTADQRDQVVALIEAMLMAELAQNGGHPFGVCRDCRHFEQAATSKNRCALLDVALSVQDSGHICVEQEAA